MNIVVPKFNMKARVHNALWAAVKGTWIAPFIGHRAQMGLAYDFRNLKDRYREEFAASLFGMQMRGAGAGWESRRNLYPVSETAIDTSGANSTTFNVYDWFQIALIGVRWTVTGTVTALAMDFDLHPDPAAAGTAVDKLDGTNGKISGFAVGDQTAGKVNYNDIADLKNPPEATPGNSVKAVVGTTTTAGECIPFVIGWPKAETFRNLSTAIRMPNT